MKLAALVASVLILLSCTPADERPGFIIATTTSVDNSGFLRHLADDFSRETGIEPRWLSVGSGKALQLAVEGKVDLVIAHDPESEREFVATGRASLHQPFARNDFVLIGPAANPAGVLPADSAEVAFRKILETGNRFVSRGDNSGTHSRELEIWRSASVDPAGSRGYTSLGQSMSAILRSARELEAYTLSDAATFHQVGGGSSQQILLDKDAQFRNVYSVILLREGTGEEAQARAGRFAEWLLSPEGTRSISRFRIHGRVGFTPSKAAN